MKFTFIFLILSFCLAFSGCATSTGKITAQVFTWEYIGEDCSRSGKDLSDLNTFKRMLDFKNITLEDAKRLVMIRIIEGDMTDTRKRSLLGLLALVEVNSDLIDEVRESEIYLTASEYIDYVIEAYEIAC